MTQKHQTSVSSRNGAVTSTDNSPSATDISEWESRIAKLVGLEEDITPSNSQIQKISQTQEKQEIQEITADKQTTDPNSVRTKQSLSANPFAKATLVGATTLAAVVVAGAFLSQIMGGGGKQQAKRNVTIPTPSQPETPNRLEQLETEVDTLKTKLALAKQAETVKAAQQKLRNIKPKPSLSQAPKTVKNISPPEVITRVVREPQPVPPPQIQTAPPAPPQPELPPAPVKPDPMEKWQKLATLGSYGMVTEDISKQNTVKTASASTKKVESPLGRSKSGLKQKPNVSIASRRRQQNGKSTVIGSSAEAVIATGIFGETTKSQRRSRSRSNKNNSDSNKDNNVFVVLLEEALKSRDGEVVVPAGSEILTQVSSISDKGLVRLNVTKVLLKGKDKNEVIERNITPNALTIRAPEGKPLIASSYPNNSSSVARRDAAIFGLGGLGRAAQLFNRTQTRIVRDEGAVFSETNNDDPNIAAGILEGGMRSLVPQITRRNQQAISRMSRKSDIWFLKAGKEVEVYVNQEVQF